MKTCSLYGFSPDSPPFVGRSPAAQVDLLRAWGNTATFGGYQDTAFVQAAHAAGLPVYAEFGCFIGRHRWAHLPESRPLIAEGKSLAIRPGLTLGLFGVPWRPSDYDSAILEIIGQDYRALGPYIGIFSPMVYHKMQNFTFDWIAQITKKIHSLTDKPIWPIIQSVDDPPPLPANEYRRALQTALHCPAADGVLVFTRKGPLDDDKLAITRTELGRCA